MILTKKERKVLRLRYALDLPTKTQTTAKETLETVGAEIGLSHTRIQKIEDSALIKLGISKSQVLYQRNEVRKLIENI